MRRQQVIARTDQHAGPPAGLLRERSEQAALTDTSFTRDEHDRALARCRTLEQSREELPLALALQQPHGHAAMVAGEAAPPPGGRVSLAGANGPAQRHT